MIIDLTKKYRTRSGREIRLLRSDLPGIFPVQGQVALSDGGPPKDWIRCCWTAEGGYFSDGTQSGMDLIEASSCDPDARAETSAALVSALVVVPQS